MTSSSIQNIASSYSAKALCRLVGLACLAGFTVDFLSISFPPALGTLQWRLGFLQQVGDRSIILLFGLALLLYGIVDQRIWRKRLALFCLILGVIFNLSCILVVRDGLAYQKESIAAIDTQASQIQAQIQKVKEDPKVAPNINAEQLQQASKNLNSRAEALQESAKSSVLKTSASSVGNLVIVGLALIGLGQYGMRPPRD
jgi:hypothetical protein